ncbi:hypothetical protein EQG41_18015 [Billgrantia azerbaijanica]|nr:hypothetical protein EQG41_18015 [Halomonas azerbaijanica]
MSKQSNEQDERKSPSGEAQGGARRGAAGGKSGGEAGNDRTPPRDKSSQQGGAAGAPAAGTPAAGKSSKSPPGSRSGSGRGSAAAKPASDKSAASAAGSGNKPQETQPQATQAEATKGKPTQGQKAGKDETSGKDEKVGQGESAAKGTKPAGDKPAERPAASGAGGGGTAAAAGGGQGKGGGKGGALALVLVVLLAIAVGFFAQRIWQRLDDQQQRLAELQSSAANAATQESLAALEQRLEAGESERNAELNAALEELRERFASYRSEIDGTLDQVLDELSTQQEPDAREWLHAEAAYLLRLANQRLQLERDVEGAIALLRTADERLSEANNPALLSVRRAIASEIAILEGVPQVDRTGIYLELSAQQERLAQLPLSRELEEIPARAGLQEAPSGGWQQQLARFGEELKDLVVIRHHDQALESLISPEQESYLRQSARLVLEQAQLALLKEEQDLYEASLDKALTLLDGYYASDREEVQAVVARLESLKGKTIRPELPDISGSQQALASFIEHRFGSRGEQGEDA